MTKTKYQEAATNYVHEYLEQLLKLEDTRSDGNDNCTKFARKKYG